MRCAIGCGVVGGVDALITFVDGAPTFGVGAGVGGLITLGGGASVGASITLGGGASTVRASVGVCTLTLGVGARVVDSWIFGGLPVGRLKMARRLFTASSWA